ncbi:FIST N-terminal domain-containing protein [Roseobacter sp. HKCCA0434]|uniref:FIST N-terminal domain-containing protein n=1 Tax=Roseobacter sp. HKCCA0434 TaxID=3079297 RepID=UPI002905E60B|nr:FIST N-terminal domain-containing protein [Roseobacter sp. HKCCA0434]
MTDLLQTAQVRWTHTDPVREIRAQIGDVPLGLLMLFVTPLADFEAVSAAAHATWPEADVVSCTTAGEIGADGYDEGLIVAIGFERGEFASTSILIEDLDRFVAEPVMDRIVQERIALQELNPRMESGCAFLVIDGLSLREDTLTATISPTLRDMPLCGASAGDGIDFRETQVSLNGHVARGAAVLTMVRSRHELRVFSHDHLLPTGTRMVVTEADPERRIVKSINAEPAAREYARIVGRDPEQLDRFTFAAHPVVVRIGGQHHVRAIQQVNDAGELVFFSAIDEGMVLTVARPQNMVEHLSLQMEELSVGGAPDHIIGCDCILRRIEAEQKQLGPELSRIMAKYRVTGFSTYGEQIGPLHVNHTMTGVAVYRHADDAP